MAGVDLTIMLFCGGFLLTVGLILVCVAFVDYNVNIELFDKSFLFVL